MKSLFQESLMPEILDVINKQSRASRESLHPAGDPFLLQAITPEQLASFTYTSPPKMATHSYRYLEKYILK